MDYTVFTADVLNFYTDSTRNFELGFGGVCDDEWFIGKWDSFAKLVKPSIEYLELYAVTVGVVIWIQKFRNKRIVLFCDNQSVVDMINSSSSSCRKCMVLIRIIVLNRLLHNVRIYARHIRGVLNGRSDALSRKNMSKFWKLSKNMTVQRDPREIPEELWPIGEIWVQ